MCTEKCINCFGPINLARDYYHTKRQIGGRKIFFHGDCRDPTGAQWCKATIKFHENLWPKKGET